VAYMLFCRSIGVCKVPTNDGVIVVLLEIQYTVATTVFGYVVIITVYAMLLLEQYSAMLLLELYMVCCY